MFSLRTCSGLSACDRILTHLWPCMVFSSEAETGPLACVGSSYLPSCVVLYICLFVPHTASLTVHVYWSVEVVTGLLGLTMLTLT